MKAFLFLYIYIIPQTVLAQLRGSYFLSIVIHLKVRIPGRQPTCLDLPRLANPAANSMYVRIAGRQPTCLDLPRLA